MKTIYMTNLCPLLEFCSCLWNTGHVGDLRLLEGSAASWTKEILGMSTLRYSERLKLLDLYSVKGSLIRADMIKCWKIFNGKCCISPGDLSVLSRDGS